MLVNTVEALKKRARLSREQLDKMEQDAGTVGAANTREQLLEVSEQKRLADEAKSVMLEEMSTTVEQITQTLKDKKSALAPQIKDLRKMRESYQEMEAHYNDAKSKWDRENSQLGMDRTRLENEVNTYQRLTTEAEQAYHFANCWSLRYEIKTDVLKTEEMLRNNLPPSKDAKLWPFGPPTRPYRDVYKQKTMQLDKENKELVGTAKNVRDTFEPT